MGSWTKTHYEVKTSRLSPFQRSMYVIYGRVLYVGHDIDKFHFIVNIVHKRSIKLNVTDTFTFLDECRRGKKPSPKTTIVKLI